MRFYINLLEINVARTISCMLCNKLQILKIENIYIETEREREIYIYKTIETIIINADCNHAHLLVTHFNGY